jgi:hypothetical protein
MPELNTLVTKSAKVIHREMPDGEAKRLPEGFDKPADGDWVCMSAEVPADDESAGDIVRVAGLNTNRHSSKSPIKLLGLHMRGTMDGAPAVIGRMEEFRLGKKSWKGKQVPAMFGRFSWAKDGDGKITELAAKYKGLWEGGYLDSVSIGFRPVKSRALNSEKPWDGYEFLESELVELSIVTIPANPAATALKAIADAFHTKEVNHASDEQDKSADTLAPHLTRLEALLDQMQDALAVAKSDDAEQTRDHGTPQEQPTIDPDALRAAIKSLL